METDLLELILVNGWKKYLKDDNLLTLLDPLKLVKLSADEFSVVLTRSFTTSEIAFIREKRMKALNNVAAKRHREKERTNCLKFEFELTKLQLERDELLREKSMLQNQIYSFTKQPRL